MAEIDLWMLRRAARVIGYQRMALCPPELNFQRAGQGVGALVVGQNLRVDIVLTGRSDTGIFVCFLSFSTRVAKGKHNGRFANWQRVVMICHCQCCAGAGDAGIDWNAIICSLVLLRSPRIIKR